MTPQARLEEFGADPGLETLTPAEKDAYQAVENHGIGVREYARRRQVEPGTIGNLLARAREKLGEGSQ